LYQKEAMARDYSDYFARLVERIDEAVKVPFRQVHHDGWEPKPNDCHGNVDWWTARHDDCKAIRGWLFWPSDAASRWRFMAHSVIERRDALVDITPIDEHTPRDELLFLKHPGTEEEFEGMKIPCSEYVYPPITLEEWREAQLSMEPAQDTETSDR
jgi:hypothetical protein